MYKTTQYSYPLPWQTKQWNILCQMHQNNRLAHALILSGLPGLGKRGFAEAFATYLLCTQPSAYSACRKCRSCHLIETGNHPDLHIITSDTPQTKIKIDQIRTISMQLQTKSFYRGYRIIIVDPAEAMNVAATNAFLKTLEEPNPFTLIMLITHQPARLLATVRSRCVSIPFSAPVIDEATTWLQAQLEQPTDIKQLLKFAHHAPLRAIELHNTSLLSIYQTIVNDLAEVHNKKKYISELAAKWTEMDQEIVLDVLIYIVDDMIKLNNPPISIQKLFLFYDTLVKQREYIKQQRNLNSELRLEDILIQWEQLYGNESFA